MGIVWIFIVAVVAVIIVYLIANRSCSCGSAAEKTAGPEKSTAPKSNQPSPPSP